jgi:metal-responsive CopG/Arc/MetJ family transcriptional regulator
MSEVETKKVTVSMPKELLVFADRMAEALDLSRSGFIASTLEQAREREREQLAAEGYQFYSSESSEFAAASESAVAEAMDDDSR